MTIVYPDTWSALQVPNIRAELLAALETASNPVAFTNTSDVEFLIHFMFDDHDFGSDARKEIGAALFDEAEASALGTFVAFFEKAIGPGSKIRTIPWDECVNLAQAAQVALLALATRGVATFKP